MLASLLSPGPQEMVPSIVSTLLGWQAGTAPEPLGGSGAPGGQHGEPYSWRGLTAVRPPSMNGALAFVDTSDCTVMNIAEHYMASDVEWDPTGRYVVTSVSWWSHKVRGAVSPCTT